tara:strand:- start:11 stop:466 length:456 start_codon:yes stop_codon:yes gene_type:complete
MVNEQTGEGTVTETTEALGMTTEEVVDEGEPRRGRGRPAGATTASRATGVDELKEEIRNIKNRIESFETDNGSSRMSNANELDAVRRSVERMDLKVSVIQQWVEMFHMFLTTSRITNSADRMAEEELTVIISKLPEQNHPLFIGVPTESST